MGVWGNIYSPSKQYMEYLDITKEPTKIQNTWKKNWRKKSVIGYKSTSRYIKKIKPKSSKKKTRKPREIIRSYKTYMGSPLWIQRKNRYWQRHKKKCAACGKPKYVTLHHKEYNNNYGDEPDHELVGLCNGCHNLFHQNNATKKNMQKETKLFIEEMRKIALVKNECYELDQKFDSMFK